MYYYVYILKSEQFTETYYTGFTTILEVRLSKHNNGEVPHTSKYKPWFIKNFIAFTDKDKALAFKKYLKSHSGRAFAKKHL
jgi:putative endonuclease